MSTVLNYLGIILLLLSILFLGRQMNVYLRMRSRLGELISPLTPSKSQLKRVKIIGVVFLFLLIVVTVQYISQGYSLTSSYSIILAIVIFSGGRFISRISELREKGILGHLEEISYSSIKSYSVDKSTNRSIIVIKLKDGRDFVAVVADKDENEVIDHLKSWIRLP